MNRLFTLYLHQKNAFIANVKTVKIHLIFFVPPHNQAGVLTEYQYWQTENKKAEKVHINGGIFEELKSLLKSFLIYHYVK